MIEEIKYPNLKFINEDFELFYDSNKSKIEHKNFLIRTLPKNKSFNINNTTIIKRKVNIEINGVNIDLFKTSNPRLKIFEKINDPIDPLINYPEEYVFGSESYISDETKNFNNSFFHELYIFNFDIDENYINYHEYNDFIIIEDENHYHKENSEKVAEIEQKRNVSEAIKIGETKADIKIQI